MEDHARYVDEPKRGRSPLLATRSSQPQPRIVRNAATPEAIPLVRRRSRNDAEERGSRDNVHRPQHPPLAMSEADDLDDDDREVVTKPQSGVDDGFFETGGNDSGSGNHPREEGNPDVEIIPTDPSDREGEDIPEITPRAGPDGGSDPDEADGGRKPAQPHGNDDRPNFFGRFPRFPFAPGYGPDVEIGSIPDLDSIPDVNVYQHKKTLAQGMMDLALFSANANQLRYVLESYNRHPYYYPSLVMISISLILQVAVGIGLIWNATFNVKDEKQICVANRINNFTLIGIFLVTVVNVFISAFGVADPSPTITVATTAVSTGTG